MIRILKNNIRTFLIHVIHQGPQQAEELACFIVVNNLLGFFVYRKYALLQNLTSLIA